MKYLYIALSSIILAYFIIALFTYLYQRKLLYHPSENNYTGDEIQFEYKEVFIEVDKDIKLKSWFLEKDLKKNKTILYFHGNAGDLTNRVHKLNELNKLDVNILVISWRGFSGNPGKPTEKNLYNDARKSVEWLNKAGVINKNILITAHGNSIRALCKYLFNLDNNQITSLEIPTGNPLIINFGENLKINECKYLDKERSKNLLVF